MSQEKAEKEQKGLTLGTLVVVGDSEQYGVLFTVGSPQGMGRGETVFLSFNNLVQRPV